VPLKILLLFLSLNWSIKSSARTKTSCGGPEGAHFFTERMECGRKSKGITTGGHVYTFQLRLWPKELSRLDWTRLRHIFLWPNKKGDLIWYSTIT
jgi:hypothetical protein